MEQPEVLILRVREQSDELAHKLVNHRQVERSKVIVVRVVDELLIDGEKVSIDI